MRKPARLILVTSFFALMLVYCLTGFYVDLVRPGSDDGWNGSGKFGEYYITKADPHGPARELRAGDQIMAINGVRTANDPSGLWFSQRVAPGTPYTMTVLRDGQELTFTLYTIPRPPGKFPYSRLVPMLFWLTGLFVFLLKAEDQQARLLGLMLGSFSGLLDSLNLNILPEGLAVLNALARLGGWWSLPLLLHLFLIFPQPSSLLRLWPSLTKWLYAPFILFVLPSFGLSRLPVHWAQPLYNWPPWRWVMVHGLYQIAFLIVLAYLLTALVCLWLSYRTADVAGRRRLRVVMLGSLLGFGCLFLVVAMEFTETQERFKAIWDWLQFLTTFTLMLVPLSFAYAIVRHRVIPISLILRRSARYVLVARGSTVLLMAGLGLVMYYGMDTLFRYWRPTGHVVGVVSALTAIVFWRVAQGFHERVIAPAIDRRFFRQAYDAQQILTELADSLRTTTGIPTLLEAVGKRLQAALQTASVAIFLRNEVTGDYQSAYACAYDPATGHSVACGSAGQLPPFAATLAYLSETNQPLELDGSKFDLADTNSHSPLLAEERQTLREAQTALLLPLTTKDALPGVIALGPRLGDLPFSGEDKRLLESVAASASLALENAQLVEQMLTEARRRQEIEAENEQRAKELEEARQLQLSMLPRSVPQLPNLKIAAFMQTATEVGGDYYDFHLSSEGTLTIAIGDATGHGLKAGTVVTATKSLFKHLAQQPDVVTTMSAASQALKQMNLRSLFMALTLVKVRGDRLHCCVAGMPPILIYRAATQSLEELPLRGVPLGGLSGYVYRQTELTLGVGDIVLLMSDGLPERFNPAQEMFDYERIRTTFLGLAQATPRAIVDGLVKAGEVWAAGRPLDDDLTLIVLKRKAEQT